MPDVQDLAHVHPGPHADPPLAPGGTPRVTDPSLASFANFTIVVDTDFNGGSGRGQNGYDGKNHRHRRAYVRPPTYAVRLDARLGLELNRAPKLAAALSPSEISFPTQVEDFDDFLRLAGDAPQDGGGGGGSSSGSIVPPDLVAFQWVLEETVGSFVETRLVMRPVVPMHLAVFQVPRPGRYRVRLRVVFADGRQAESVTHFSFRDWFIVSMGDSAASGEGNPDEHAHLGPTGGTFCRNTSVAMVGDSFADLTPNLAMDPVWTEAKAHRSMQSGPALAALALQRRGGQTWVAGGQQVQTLAFEKVVFASFARSGAGILTGLIAPQGGSSDFIGAGQFEECRRTAAGRRIDALMISIGGNDLGFSGVLKDLVRGDSVFRARLKFLGTGSDASARRAIERKLDAMLGIGLPAGQKGDLEIRYDALRDQVEALRRRPGLGEVYITGYPTGLFEVRSSSGKLGFRACEVFSGPDLDITKPDATAIQNRGRALNALIRRKAQEFGWHFVDVDADFEGHGYCAREGGRYWVHAEESCRRQGDFDGTMHPNHIGQRVYALRLAQAMRLHTIGLSSPIAPPSPGAPQGPVAPVP